MFRDFIDHLIRQKHCFACKHFKSAFSRYSTFDYGVCEKTHVVAPVSEKYCRGTSFELDYSAKKVQDFLKDLDHKK